MAKYLLDDFGIFDDQLKSTNSLAHFECDPDHLLT
jgi:hypothetical protein